MTALDLLRAGDPGAALDALKAEVRRAPRDPKLRTFLFQLACVLGDWDRALAQAAVAAELDPEAVPMAQTYRMLIGCERQRGRVFAGEVTPTVLGAPEPWMPLLFEANRLLAAGEPEAAATLRDQAFDQAPASAGTLNDTPFEWIADADPRLGPMIEAIVDGRYFWLPFTRLASLEIEPPVDLRDTVWTPARFVWANGGDAPGFIPTRYPGSERPDPGLALARRTEWRAVGPETAGWSLGLGQRMLATDAGETALLDLRALHAAVPALA